MWRCDPGNNSNARTTDHSLCLAYGENGQAPARKLNQSGFPGFKATPQALTQVVSRREELHLNPDDNLVLDLLSNSSFMGTDEEGLPTPAMVGEGGTYHIPGSLLVAPASAVTKILGNCQQIGKLGALCQQVTLVAPILRYVTSKCCNNENHVDNYNSEEFKFEIIVGIEMQKSLLEGWATKLNLNFCLIDATELVDPVDPVLRNRQTRSGIPLWTTWDLAHLVHEAYQEMADSILSPDNASVEDIEAASTPSSESADTGHKRRRPEAVITGQTTPHAKRGKSSLESKPAGWLLGKADWGRGRGRAGSRPARGLNFERNRYHGRATWKKWSCSGGNPADSRGRGWKRW